MIEVDDKADITRANTGDPTPWVLIIFCAAVVGVMIGLLLYLF